MSNKRPYARRLVVVLSCGLGVALFVVVISALGFAGYRVNCTPSMPQGLYRLSTSAFARGDTVSYCLDVAPFAVLARDRAYLRPGTCANGLEPLVKILAGLPGDILAITPEGLWINGRLQPRSRVCPQDRLHRPLSSLLRSGRIPLGQALLLSDHPGGFDGRYFGLVPLAAVQKVRPVLVF